MSKKLPLFIFILVTIVVAVEGYVLLQTYQNPTKKYTGPMEKITLGVSKVLLPSLVWVAENKGYFAEQGVEVTIKEFDSGQAAFTAMLNPPAGGEGGLDMATVAQTPIMISSFDRHDFAIVAAMVSSYNDVRVIAMRDRGIIRPIDLRGKTIGVAKGSTSQYFLDLFLAHAGITSSEVNVVDTDVSQLTASIQQGTVDAISTFQPYAHNAEKALGGNGIAFPAKKIFREDFYFVANQQFLQDRSEALTRFLQALKQAEQFTDAYQDEAMSIVSKRLGLEKDFISSVWDDFQFGLFLDQTIIKTIEDEARWAIQNKLTLKTAIPNYRDFVFADALKKVAPERVLMSK